MSQPPPLRVLVVEDSESDFDLLLAHLRRGQVRVDAHRVQDETGLRQALAAGPWDLVISDYNLPGFGALAALALCQEAALEAPFILMSGAIGEEAAAEAMRVGATDFVPKDRPGRLVPAIHRSLEAVEARRSGGRAQAQLAAVAANVPGALFRLRTSAEGRLLALDYLSEGAAGLFGVDPAACCGDPDLLWARFGDPQALPAALAESARGGGAPIALEFTLVSGGPQRWIHVRASPRADGDALAWSGVVTDVSALKAAEWRLRESESQLRSLTAHLERVKEEERGRIARELHDELGGMLTAMRLDLAQVPRADLAADLAARLGSLDGLVSEAMRSCQAIARALRPSALDQGLVPALQWQARDFELRHGIAVRFHANEPALELEPAMCTALFRISQEALTNIAKHAGAMAVEITLFASPREVSLEIRDDGRGILPTNLDRTGSFGVFGMHERVRHLGGWLEIDGAPGKGTTLMASVPRRARAGAA